MGFALSDEFREVLVGVAAVATDADEAQLAAGAPAAQLVNRDVQVGHHVCVGVQRRALRGSHDEGTSLMKFRPTIGYFSFRGLPGGLLLFAFARGVVRDMAEQDVELSLDV